MSTGPSMVLNIILLRGEKLPMTMSGLIWWYCSSNVAYKNKRPKPSSRRIRPQVARNNINFLKTFMWSSSTSTCDARSSISNPTAQEWYLGWMSHILEDQPRMKSRHLSRRQGCLLFMNLLNCPDLSIIRRFLATRILISCRLENNY